MQSSTIDGYHSRYRKIRAHFDEVDVRTAAKEIEKLLQNMLRSILDENFVDIYSDPEYKEAKKKISQAEDKEIDWDVDKLCELYDSVDIFTLCGERKQPKLKQNSPLLRSFKLCDLLYLIRSIKEGHLDPDTQRLGVQQALCFILALLVSMSEMEVQGVHLLVDITKLKSLMTSVTEEKREENIDQYIRYLDGEGESLGVFKKEFDLIKVRGMLINIADGSRNVSFSCDTFVRILTTLHDEVVRFVEEKCERGAEMARNVAARALFQAGYTSGAEFGRTLYRLFQRDTAAKSLQQKIAEWCKFDSDVGFGLFRAEEVTTEGNRIEAMILLSDNFIVVGKDASDVNLCVFMCGYIQGVLERVTKLPLKVMHDPLECEQFIPGKTDEDTDPPNCTFRVSTDLDRLKKTMSAVKVRQERARHELDYVQSAAEKKLDGGTDEP